MNDNLEQMGLLTAVEQSADAVVFTGPDGNIRFVNPAFTALTGYSREEAIGQNPRLFKSGRQPEAFYKQMWQTIRSGKPWQGDLINRRKDGSLYTEEMRIAQIRDSQGGVSGYLAIKRDVTEKRSAEEAQALLASIVASSEDAIYSTDLEGTILSWNRGAEALFCYTSQEILGKSVRILSRPEPAKRIPAILESIRKGLAIPAYDTVFLRKDGRGVDVSLTVSPIRSSGGEIAGAAVIVRDISERCRAEKAQALLASIVESGEDGISSATLDGTILTWNPGAEKLLGYSREEIVGRNLSLILMPGRGEQLRRILEAAGKGLAIVPYDAVLRAKDGSRAYVSFSIFPVRNSAGAVVGVSGIARDISRRLQTERKLQESEERFRRVFDQAPIGMAATTLDGHIVMANAAFCSIMGHSEEELLVMSWTKLTHPEDLPFSREMLERLLETPGESAATEKRYIRRDGETVWGQVTVSLMRDGDGKPLHYVVHVQDISERKRNQNSLLFQHSLICAIHEVLLDGILVVNDANLIVSHNQRFKDIWQFSELDIPENLPDFFVGGQPPRVLSAVLERVKDPEAFLQRIRELNEDPDATDHCEIELRDDRIIERYSAGLHVAGGRHLGRVWFFRDITDRKRAEEKLQEIASRLSLATRAGGVGVWDFDIVKNSGFWDDQMFRLNGIARDCPGAPYEKWLAGLHPEDRQRANAEFMAALRDEAEFNTEFRVVWPDDSIHYIRALASVQRDSSGKIVRAIGTNWEITAQKQAEAQLRENEERYRATFEQAAVGIIHTTVEGRFLGCNARFAEILGYAQEEIRGMTYLQLTHPDDVQNSAGIFALLANNLPTLRSFEKRYIRKDGSLTWVRLTPSLQYDSRGGILHAIAFVEDINDRKLAEEAIRESHEFAQSTIDALASHICVLDEAGTIIAVNQMWTQFSSANRKAEPVNSRCDFKLDAGTGVDANYLAVCARTVGPESKQAAEFANGIRSVLAGRVDSFSMEYPCHS
ncbi:MAG: PAS domain S-box protein, partial [Terracidiphilus sp.]